MPRLQQFLVLSFINQFAPFPWGRVGSRPADVNFAAHVETKWSADVSYKRLLAPMVLAVTTVRGASSLAYVGA
jgi:hypothetical protein